MSSFIVTLSIFYTTYAFQWRRVLKINKNIQLPNGGSAYDFYSQLGTTYSTMAAEESYMATSGTLLTIEPTNFKSLLISDWANGGIITVQKVRLSFCINNAVDKAITFNSQTSTWLTWLTLANIELSPWSDLTSSTNTQPVGIQSWWAWRSFVSWGQALTCDSDTAWFFISIPDPSDCTWEGNDPAIIYSPLNTIALIPTSGQEADAFIMEIYYEVITTQSPTKTPTINTNSPTNYPTKQPTFNPSLAPSKFPTNNPSQFPTNNPSLNPTKFPTSSPTKLPSSIVSDSPTQSPMTKSPTYISSTVPIRAPNTSRSAPIYSSISSSIYSTSSAKENVEDEETFLENNFVKNMILVFIGILIFGACSLCVLFFYYKVYGKRNQEIDEGIVLVSGSNTSPAISSDINSDGYSQTTETHVPSSPREVVIKMNEKNENNMTEQVGHENAMPIHDIYEMDVLKQQMDQMAMNMNMGPVYMNEMNGPPQQINQMKAMEPGASPEVQYSHNNEAIYQMPHMAPLPPPPVPDNVLKQYHD